jgi:hypothetical protein
MLFALIIALLMLGGYPLDRGANALDADFVEAQAEKEAQAEGDLRIGGVDLPSMRASNIREFQRFVTNARAYEELLRKSDLANRPLVAAPTAHPVAAPAPVKVVVVVMTPTPAVTPAGAPIPTPTPRPSPRAGGLLRWFSGQKECCEP